MVVARHTNGGRRGGKTEEESPMWWCAYSPASRSRVAATLGRRTAASHKLRLPRLSPSLLVWLLVGLVTLQVCPVDACENYEDCESCAGDLYQLCEWCVNENVCVNPGAGTGCSVVVSNSTNGEECPEVSSTPDQEDTPCTIANGCLAAYFDTTKWYFYVMLMALIGLCCGVACLARQQMSHSVKVVAELNEKAMERKRQEKAKERAGQAWGDVRDVVGLVGSRGLDPSSPPSMGSVMLAARRNSRAGVDGDGDDELLGKVPSALPPTLEVDSPGGSRFADDGGNSSRRDSWRADDSSRGPWMDSNGRTDSFSKSRGHRSGRGSRGTRTDEPSTPVSPIAAPAPGLAGSPPFSSPLSDSQNSHSGSPLLRGGRATPDGSPLAARRHLSFSAGGSDSPGHNESGSTVNHHNLSKLSVHSAASAESQSTFGNIDAKSVNSSFRSSTGGAGAATSDSPPHNPALSRTRAAAGRQRSISQGGASSSGLLRESLKRTGSFSAAPGGGPSSGSGSAAHSQSALGMSSGQSGSDGSPPRRTPALQRARRNTESGSLSQSTPNMRVRQGSIESGLSRRSGAESTALNRTSTSSALEASTSSARGGRRLGRANSSHKSPFSNPASLQGAATGINMNASMSSMPRS